MIEHRTGWVTFAAVAGIVAIAAGSLTGCGVDDGSTAGPVAACAQGFRVVSTIPRDDPAFTQGLVFVGDRLFESTGRYGESALREVDPDTLATIRSEPLPDELFGEGLAHHDGRLVQLTWREQRALVWGIDTWRPDQVFTYVGEGWGLTTDGDAFVQSDGSAVLRWRDTATFDVERELEVHDATGPITQLNELELVDGMVFANVFGTATIVVVDPADGRVVASLDLSSLVPELADDDPNAVLNGIALVPGTGELLVTGKHWPAAHRLALDTPCWP